MESLGKKIGHLEISSGGMPTVYLNKDLGDKSATFDLYGEKEKIVMTREQYGAFKKLYNRYYGCRFFFALKAIEEDSEFSSLYDLATFDAIHNLNFAELWACYDKGNPGKFIKVIHDVRYYIISYEIENGRFAYLDKKKSRKFPYAVIGSMSEALYNGVFFDTKEEADKWLTPNMRVIRKEV